MKMENDIREDMEEMFDYERKLQVCLTLECSSVVFALCLLIEKKVITYSDPMVTYSHPKMTYSYPKVK